ncbi:MAG TPA: hypothetical protein VIC28_04515 [Thermoanaerobaculia bacterium]
MMAAEPAAAPATTSIPRPAAPLRKRLLLAAVSLLVSLLLAEGVLRLTGVAAAGRGAPWFAGGNHPRFLFAPDRASGYTLRPGFHGREVAPGREFEVPVTIDARGLRDHRHTAAPQPAVLALGDSMTFGEGVGEEEAWSAILERALGVRVYDGGVPGYSSPQMLARLRRLLPALRPRLVLVALSPHWDQQRCAEPFLYLGGFIVAGGYAPRLHLIDGNLYLADVRWPVVGPVTAYAKRWSHLARLLLPAVRAGAAAVVGERSRGETSGDVGPSAAALLAMRRDAAAAGARFLVIFLDSRGRVYAEDRDALAAALLRQGIEPVALDRLLAGEDWQALRYPRDQHWNARGHRAVGEALAPIVRRRLE